MSTATSIQSNIEMRGVKDLAVGDVIISVQNRYANVVAFNAQAYLIKEVSGVKRQALTGKEVRHAFVEVMQPALGETAFFKAAHLVEDVEGEWLTWNFGEMVAVVKMEEAIDAR